MLSDQVQPEDGCSADLNTSTPNGPFKDTFGSLVKTYVMMIGEFEYEGSFFFLGLGGKIIC